VDGQFLMAALQSVPFDGVSLLQNYSSVCQLVDQSIVKDVPVAFSRLNRLQI
jgi:hypothetical protein